MSNLSGVQMKRARAQAMAVKLQAGGDIGEHEGSGLGRLLLAPAQNGGLLSTALLGKDSKLLC